MMAEERVKAIHNFHQMEKCQDGNHHQKKKKKYVVMEILYGPNITNIPAKHLRI